MIEPCDAQLLAPGATAQAIALPAMPLPAAGPLVSCIMPTRGALQPAWHAIGCFRRQRYAARELVVTCAEADSAVERHVAGLRDPAIRFVAADGAQGAAALRNRAIAAAAGELLCLWDDDDLSHPDRIGWQVAALDASEAAGCFLSRELLWWPARRRIAVSASRVWENSMLAARAAVPAYAEGMARGADTVLAQAMRAAVPLILIDRPLAYCYVAHGRNLWGAEHFEMLFGHASEEQAGDAHDRAIARLAALPLADYAAGLGITATSAG